MSRWVEFTCPKSGQPVLINIDFVARIRHEDPRLRGANCLIDLEGGREQAVTQSYAQARGTIDKLEPGA